MNDQLQTNLIRRQSTLELASFELAVTSGPDRGTKLPLLKGSARIGTAASNDLRLTDATVSRLHCEVSVVPSGVRVVDLGSTNGTFVNHVEITDAKVQAGAAITIGSTTIAIQQGDEPVHIPLSDRDHFGFAIGQSVEMRRVYSMIERIAPTDVTVLIEGETGTGKEVIARTIHEASNRAAQAFVVVDCGAISEHLIEAELFGHARGAFTGASEARQGLFEEANGGTIFLDEIGELPLALQPKLLRVLESRQVRRVGENAARPVDVRVLAATNRSLASNVNEGSFREDLYYRLAVMKLELPPLRSRRDDIPLLAAHFYRRATGENAELPKELIPELIGRSWPGNVRELRNFVERAACLGVGEARAAMDGPSTIPLPDGVEALIPVDLPFKEARGAWMDRFETFYLSTLLKKTNGNVTRAAEMAGMHRRTLQRIMLSLGMRATD